MRFLLDECISPSVAEWMRSQGYDAVSVHEVERGLDDAAVLEMAVTEQRILVTNDKGFGERIIRLGQQHCGIVLLRLENRRTAPMIETLRKLLHFHQDSLANALIVVTERTVRINKV